LTQADVINTKSLKDLQQALRQKRA
jgi:hypothetical protein